MKIPDAVGLIVYLRPEHTSKVKVKVDFNAPSCYESKGTFYYESKNYSQEFNLVPGKVNYAKIFFDLFIIDLYNVFNKPKTIFRDFFVEYFQLDHWDSRIPTFAGIDVPEDPNILFIELKPYRRVI